MSTKTQPHLTQAKRHDKRDRFGTHGSRHGAEKSVAQGRAGCNTGSSQSEQRSAATARSGCDGCDGCDGCAAWRDMDPFWVHGRIWGHCGDRS